MISAIFVPHAGKVYSGHATGTAYRHVDFSKYKEVVMFSTNHYYRSDRLVTTEKYRHPKITKHVEMVEESVFEKEHSWKNQMDFIPPTVNLRIFLVGDLVDYKSVAKYFFQFVNPKVLLIFNSDLSHENPGSERKKKTGKSIYQKEKPFIDSLVKLTNLPNQRHTFCGINVMRLMTLVLQQGYYIGKKTAYYQSGNIKQKVPLNKLIGVIDEYNVSYLAIVYRQLPLKQVRHKYLKYQKEIVKFGYDILQEKHSSLHIPNKLKQRKVYCFVTIRDKTKSYKELVLGCMRNSDYQPLDVAIREAIISIKERDSRFKKEIPYSQMAVSVTILGKPKKINNKSEIKLGKHGISLITGDEDLGVYYLADVPIDQGWNIDETLISLKGKGGISGDLFGIYKVPELKLELKKGGIKTCRLRRSTRKKHKQRKQKKILFEKIK